MSGQTIAVTDDNFEEKVIKSQVPVLVDFWAPWCGPCVAIGPVLDQLAEEFGDKVTIAKMNVDENANVPATFGVRSIPYLVLIKGGNVVDTVVGVQPKAKLKEIIDKNLG